MKIDELITFCEEEEQNHRVKCKRADDASGYTRSKDKNIRTACAIREDTYADFYKEIVDTMRKYKKIQKITRWNNAPSPYYKPDGQLFREIIEVLEDGKID